MILKDTVKKVENSKIFKEFIKKHPSYYLVHCFTMLSKGERKYKWEFGYYSDKSDRMVVFETEPKVKMRPEEEALKKEGVIKKLGLSKIKISVGKALGVCDDLIKQKYPHQLITKKIIILQHLEKDIYNITLISKSFSIVNIKIDASSGEVLQENIQSIMSLGKKV